MVYAWGMNIAVILPAAGQSKRFGASGSKLEANLGGRAVLVRAVELFSGRPNVKQIIIAVDPDKVDTFKFKWADKLGMLGVKIVAGGRKERWETVLNALSALDDNITHIAVHDAARPVSDAAMIDRAFKAAESHAAVIPAVPVSATIKRIEGQAMPPNEAPDPLDAILGSAGKTVVEAFRVVETVPREGLWLIQTPQVFERSLIERAYEQIRAGKLDASKITDDAGLVEAMGEPVAAVIGDALNVKITVPDDLKFAEAVLAMRSGRVGAEALGPKRQHPTWAQMDED
ncbi:MAG: NTP transferase domain-containing protein [Planctomycetes bacterium]|nr:NTP transferase domain-containing protein [Planctomycetota bacterium]